MTPTAAASRSSSSVCLSLTEYDYLPPVKLWVLHPDRDAGPQWRRCEMTLSRFKQNSVYVSFKIRRLAGGAEIDELFNSIGFRAGLDQMLTDILHIALPHSMPEYQQHYLMNAKTKGTSMTRDRSPQLGFQTSTELRDILDTMSNHDRVNLLKASEKVASRQERHRAAFGPIR